jgi:hypothetical protein
LSLDPRGAVGKIRDVLEAHGRKFYEVKSYENSPDPEQRTWIDILLSDVGLTFDELSTMLNDLERVLGVNSPRKAFLSATTFEGKLLVGFPLNDVQGIRGRFQYIA